MRRLALFAALAAALALPTVAGAQGGPGFLFRQPRVSVGMRTGYSVPRASGTIFHDAFQQFKLNSWDMSSPSLGAEVAVRGSERWDFAASFLWARSRSLSEYRDWVDQDAMPIEQETTFETVETALGARYYFSDRGRSIGRFAWVPSRLTPYVGAGVGYTWYTFEQVGDFVDFQTLDVVGDALRTDGGGATAHAGVGAELSIGKQFFLTGEARYRLASGDVRGEFSTYDGIDLSGLQLIAGVAVRW
jgi:hypothetical protein